MRRTPLSIKDLLSQPDPVPPPATTPAAPPPESAADAAAASALPSLDDLNPLPVPGDPYVAASRSVDKSVTSLVLVLADASARAFNYGNLDTCDLLPGEAGQGPVIVLRFYGVVAQEVILAGRRLEKIYSQLTQHRLGWLRELSPDRDFGLDTATAITRISIQKFKEEG